MQEWLLPEIHKDKCTGCGICENECPTGAVRMIENKPVFICAEVCSYCGICEDACPEGAIELHYQIS
jgi:NAD-dependent dihydropyrimidine dehydrogenase PreA subunit